MQERKKGRLTTNFFSLGIVQAINSSLQLLAIPQVIKATGADGFGIIAVAQVVMIYLGTFTEYGFNQTATRRLSIARNDPNEISSIFFRVVYSRLFLVFFSFLILLLLIAVVPLFRSHSLHYLMGFAFVFGQAMLLSWFFQGLEKMTWLVLATFIGRALFVILVFIFIRTPGDGHLYLFFLGIGLFVSALISMIIAFRTFHLVLKKPSWTEIKTELSAGWRFTITNLSMNTCQYANIMILRFFTNDLVVGYFSVAERIYFTAKQGLVVFSQSVYPRVCQILQVGKEQWRHFIRTVFVPFLLVVIAGSVLLFVLAPQVLYFFSGPASVHSVSLLRILCFVLVIVCLNIPSTLALMALDRQRMYFGIYTLGGLINIVSGVILCYFFQTNGTLLAIFITEIFITTGVLIAMSRLDLNRKTQPGQHA